MGATLTHKDKGEIEYEIIYANSGVGKVGKLVGGGYMHVGGIPIKTKKELTDVIAPGPERDEALKWFENRNKVPEVPKKKVVIQPDGNLLYDDGTEITTHAEIINDIPAGALQEYALKWFVEKQNRAATATLKESSRIRHKVNEIRKEALEKQDDGETEE